MTVKRTLVGVLSLAIAAWAIGISYSLHKTLNAPTDPASQHASADRFESDESNAQILLTETTADEVLLHAEEDTVQNAAPGSSVLVNESAVEQQAAFEIAVPAQERCTLVRSIGIFPGETRLAKEYLDTLSDDEFRELVDSREDAYSHYLYAERVRSGELQRLIVDANERGQPLEVLDSELFARTKDYYVRAIRGGNWQAAMQLFPMYFNVDRVEARAWLVIAEASSGPNRDVISSVDDFGLYVFTEQEKRAGEARAAELISEFALEPDLHEPDLCI